NCAAVAPSGKATILTVHTVPMVGPDSVSSSGPRAHPANSNSRPRRISITRTASAAEVVEQDVLGLDTEIAEHLPGRAQHHRRAAQVVLAVLRRRMRLQTVLVHRLVD